MRQNEFKLYEYTLIQIILLYIRIYILPKNNQSWYDVGILYSNTFLIIVKYKPDHVSSMVNFSYDDRKLIYK